MDLSLWRLLVGACEGAAVPGVRGAEAAGWTGTEE